MSPTSMPRQSTLRETPTVGSHDRAVVDLVHEVLVLEHALEALASRRLRLRHERRRLEPRERDRDAGDRDRDREADQRVLGADATRCAASPCVMRSARLADHRLEPVLRASVGPSGR